jgi:hypothetical protein
MIMQARLAAAERVRREHEFEKQALRRKIETDAMKIEALADMRQAMCVTQNSTSIYGAPSTPGCANTTFY